MEFYYDFSGQKFGYPLSLSINGFSRSVFSRQASLEISYVLRGTYDAITSGFSETLRARDMIVIAPYEMHMLKKRDGSSVILTLHIDFSRMASSMSGDWKEAFSTAVCSPERNRESYMKLKRKLGALLSILMDEKDDIYRMNVLMNEMLSIASGKRSFSMAELPLQSDQHENYMKAIRFIDAHSKEDITLSDIAEQLSFSLSYTSRIMKKYTGLSFVKYLSHVRVRSSLEELLEGRESIERIAEDCGMASGKAYAEAFRDLYGISPSAYRKQFRENLRFTEGETKEKMQLDESHRVLLRELREEAEESVYEDESIEVRNRDGEFIVTIKGRGVKMEPGTDGSMILRIEGSKQN